MTRGRFSTNVALDCSEDLPDPMHRLLTVLASCALALIAPLPEPAAAQGQGRPVVLRAKSGAFEFAARLRSYDGRVYVIQSAMGTLALDAQLYDCQGEGCPAGNKPAEAAAARPAAGPAQVGIHGSGTIGGSLLPGLLRGYAASLGGAAEEGGTDRDGEVTIRVTGGPGKPDLAHVNVKRLGSVTAFPALASGAAEIGMADRAATEDEQRSLNVPGQPPLREHVLGLDGLVIIVARENKVEALGMDQVARIFAGEITDWSALGQAAGPIKVYAPDAGRGTLDHFMRLVMKPANLPLGPYVTRLGNYDEMALAVARDPRAIAVVSQSNIGEARAVALRQACGVVVQASPFAIKTEEYPLARRLHFYTRGEPASPFARGFVQFVLSRAAQPIVAEARFVDQSIEQVAFAGEEARFQAQPTWLDPAPWRLIVAQLRPAQRLSIAFRFDAGSSEMQAKSRQDLVRLADLIKAGRVTGRTLLLVGYTDSVGTPQANTALALKRAVQVRTALLGLAPVTQTGRVILPLALGSAAPVACNDTAAGQYVNRRVEVWVRD